MSNKLMSRVLRPNLQNKIVKASEAVKYFKNGMSLGWSGFTPAGYPKAVPIAVADYVEKTKEQMKFDLFCGASMGSETEDRWASLGMIKR